MALASGHRSSAEYSETHRNNLGLRLIVLSVLPLSVSDAAYADITLQLFDYAFAPKTGAAGTIDDPVDVTNDACLARINFMAEEPGGGQNRFFVSDLNGPLYILEKTTKTFTEYLNF